MPKSDLINPNAKTREALLCAFVETLPAMLKAIEDLPAKDQMKTWISILPYILPKLHSKEIKLDQQKLDWEKIEISFE